MNERVKTWFPCIAIAAFLGGCTGQADEGATSEALTSTAAASMTPVMDVLEVVTGEDGQAPAAADIERRLRLCAPRAEGERPCIGLRQQGEDVDLDFAGCAPPHLGRRFAGAARLAHRAGGTDVDVEGLEVGDATLGGGFSIERVASDGPPRARLRGRLDVDGRDRVATVDLEDVTMEMSAEGTTLDGPEGLRVDGRRVALRRLFRARGACLPARGRIEVDGAEGAEAVEFLAETPETGVVEREDARGRRRERMFDPCPQADGGQSEGAGPDRLCFAPPPGARERPEGPPPPRHEAE